VGNSALRDRGRFTSGYTQVSARDAATGKWSRETLASGGWSKGLNILDVVPGDSRRGRLTSENGGGGEARPHDGDQCAPVGSSYSKN